MIKNRMEWYMENRQLLNPFQYGFRKGRGVQDNLGALYSKVAASVAVNEFAVVVLIDISSAYDNVVIPKLSQRLSEYGIPLDLSDLIFSFIRDRQICVIEPSSGCMVGPKPAYKGLPQGSPLSPLLFNIYCDPIKNIVGEDVLLLGYADDYALVGTGSNVDIIIDQLNSSIDNLTSFLQDNGLHLSVNKCKALLFREGRELVSCHRSILVNHSPLTWSSQIMYLGVIFDRNLSWKPHVNMISMRAQKGINILRSLCRTWWGAAPSTLLLLYRALIRSHLDNGSIFLSRCSKQVTLQLDRLQYQALRIALGLMRSTPINVLLSEGRECPLATRRLWLAHKWVAKLLSYRNPVIHIIMELHDTFLRDPQYWRRSNIPAILEAYQSLSQKLNHILLLPTLPCFMIGMDTLASPLFFTEFDLSKQNNNKAEFARLANLKFPNYTHFYTDGSKDTSGRVGYGIFSPTIAKVSASLPSYFSICAAEIWAIKEALRLILDQSFRRVVIFSDSKSALLKITQTAISAHSDLLSLQTKRYVLQAVHSGIAIALVWIPSHCYIPGNDTADRLASMGRYIEPTNHPQADFREFLPEIKSNLWISWSTEYSRLGQHKGVTYHSSIPAPLKKPWFNTFTTCPRDIITTITRMRSNHFLTMAHLHKIRIKEHDRCECGETQDLWHIFFVCTQNQANIRSLHTSIHRMNKQQGPLSLHEILFEYLNIHNLKALHSFLTSSHLKL
ncbi:uncharacterized protein [Leptinotarsa decemlineata]|uniref:uncharacterized protein n=1 Tax=Leptinotarsa decemlineata TaxID=7539 RepID=UPI003D306546